MRFDEAKLLQVTRKCRLRHAQLLRGESSAQFFLVRDARVRDDPKNLSVPECLAAIHRKFNYTRLPHFYTENMQAASTRNAAPAS